MYVTRVFFGLMILALASCAKKQVAKTPAPIPRCVQNIIAQKKKAKPENPAASVYRYQYKGKTVYYIPARCCDIPSKVVDDHCITLCFPSGGYSGKGDGKCADFLSEATNKELVWQDSRGTK
jgi:hypothetical protein